MPLAGTVTCPPASKKPSELSAFDTLSGTIVFGEISIAEDSQKLPKTLETVPVAPVIPVAPVAPVTPIAPVAPVPPGRPVAPVGPVRLSINDAVNTEFSLLFSRMSFFVISLSVFTTLEFTFSKSLMVAGGPVNPGSVPRTY
ncbi:hypothetical protein C7R91_22620 [Brevibacillus formosus]|nr:hypothetical protein C7R91_22620 [Brevibacillus formosus]